MATKSSFLCEVTARPLHVMYQHRSLWIHEHLLFCQSPFIKQNILILVYNNQIAAVSSDAC